MENLIDIHSHILPGADDGSDSFEMSLQMLKCAADDGISQIIFTPHNKPGHRHMHFSEMTSKVEKLREMMSEEKMNIELYIGSELYYRSGLLEEIENDMAETLAGSRYVLVEFNPLEDYDYIRNGIYSLLMGGYDPILAHAERYQNVCTQKYGIDDLVKRVPCLSNCADYIRKKYGEDYSKKLFCENPLYVIKDKEIALYL